MTPVKIAGRWKFRELWRPLRLTPRMWRLVRHHLGGLLHVNWLRDMAQKSIRFGVGNSGELHGATWKLWTETSGGNSEIYLACRALGGELKVSLHQSGKWHVAFNQKTYDEKVKDAVPSLNSRFVDSWEKPHEISDGMIMAVRIITPESAVSSSVKVKKPNTIKWVPTPPSEKAVEISILITKTHLVVPDWPGKESPGTELLGSFTLNNGSTVWVVFHLIDCSDFTKFGNGTGHFFKGKSKDDLNETDDYKGLVFGEDKIGTKVIYDVAVDTSAS